MVKKRKMEITIGLPFMENVMLDKIFELGYHSGSYLREAHFRKK